MGIAGSVALLVWAIALQMQGLDGSRVFSFGILAWMAGMVGGFWVNGPRRA